MNIQKYIMNNFKDANITDIKDSITASFKDENEITLPGLGVFFKLIWEKSDEENKTKILNTLKDSLN